MISCLHSITCIAFETIPAETARRKTGNIIERAQCRNGRAAKQGTDNGRSGRDNHIYIYMNTMNTIDKSYMHFWRRSQVWIIEGAGGRLPGRPPWRQPSDLRQSGGAPPARCKKEERPPLRGPSRYQTIIVVIILETIIVYIMMIILITILIMIMLMIVLLLYYQYYY